MARPVPPAELIFAAQGHRDAALYMASSQREFDILRSNLTAIDLTRPLQRVLDWGCGAGRITRRWLDQGSGTEIHGCDVNQSAVKWAQTHLTGAQFYPCSLLPPTLYPTNTFDFVYGLSVFTHLGLEAQFAWMRELWRILRPGGIALLTFHGSVYLNRFIAMGGLELCFFDGFPAGIINKHEAEGSNKFGTVHMPEALKRIFAPFQCLRHVPRQGMCGDQDTLVVQTQKLLDSPPLEALPPICIDIPAQQTQVHHEVELPAHRTSLVAYLERVNSTETCEVAFALYPTKEKSTPLVYTHANLNAPRPGFFQTVHLTWPAVAHNAVLRVEVNTPPSAQPSQVALRFTSVW